MSNTVSTWFDELAALAVSQALPPILTLTNATLADIETNPQEWLNPISGLIKGKAFLDNLVATLPAIENNLVPAAAQVVSSALSTISAKIASLAAGQTPTTLGTAIGDTIVGVTPAAPAPAVLQTNTAA